MATERAIAIRREAAIKRLVAASNDLEASLGVDTFVEPQQLRDLKEHEAATLEAVAAFVESVAEIATSGQWIEGVSVSSDDKAAIRDEITATHVFNQDAYGDSLETKLNDMLKDDLRQMADEMGVEYTSGSTKAEIIDAIMAEAQG